MIYEVSHRTVFSYTSSVAVSQHLLHLTPRSCPNQSTLHHSMLVHPAPTLRKESVDYFGNLTTYLTVESPHNRLTVASTSKIEKAPEPMPTPEATLPWDQVLQTVSRQTDEESLNAYQFAFDTPFTVSRDAAAYATASFPPGRPVLAGAIDLMHRIHRDFKYEGGVTDIQTPVDQVLLDKRGVCQDFAHLQIACLRAIGLPARYVSGYLRTHPPEGQERRIGADASHAWLSLWVPGERWVDMDPTNNLLPSDEHITVAWGRDYSDVSPINGFVVGGGHQSIEVAVNVRPITP